MAGTKLANKGIIANAKQVAYRPNPAILNLCEKYEPTQPAAIAVGKTSMMFIMIIATSIMSDSSMCFR